MSERKSSGFMLKQRAFLKLYLISIMEREKLYGLQILETLRDEFKEFGYRPNSSEIYKSLHELVDDGIFLRYEKLKEGTKLQKVVLYKFNDYEKAKLYKKQLKMEIDRCTGLLNKALKDNFS